MHVDRVIQELSVRFLGKNIIKNDEQNPTEILCEIEPTREHEEYSVAVAVIEKSIPHYHNNATETYTVLKGKTTVYVDDQAHELQRGDTLTIHPWQKHWAIGTESWIECRSEPGWTPEDHIVV